MITVTALTSCSHSPLTCSADMMMAAPAPRHRPPACGGGGALRMRGEEGVRGGVLLGLQVPAGPARRLQLPIGCGARWREGGQ